MKHQDQDETQQAPEERGVEIGGSILLMYDDWITWYWRDEIAGR